MEGKRFDELARAMAFSANRRGAMKGMLAGALALGFGLPKIRRGAAQDLVPIGGRCSAFGNDFECSQAGTPSGGIPVICSDNSVDSDGPFNCCRNAGGVCSADFHCCGTAMCSGGVCGGSGGTGGQQGGSRALGEACSATAECSQTGGSVVCASNGLPEDGAKNCCRNSGGTCGSDLQCCAGFYCINGRCGGSSSGTSGSGSTSGGGNKRPGEECTSSGECSQTGGSTVCADNGFLDDGAKNCCRPEGGRCSDSTYSADCCGGLYCRDGVCRGLPTDGTLAPGAVCTETAECDQISETTHCSDNGLADDGPLNCCRYEGGGCANDAGCCAGLLCIGSRCSTASGTTSAGGGRLAPGSACESTSQCSQSGGAVSCADNGLGYDGPLNCCRYAGGACSDGAGCCDGLDCIGGVCGGASAGGGGGGGASSGRVGIGGACSNDEQCSQEGAPTVCRDNGLPGDGDLNCCRYSGHACGNDSHCCAGYLCIGGACTAI
jgi:hypothetical protein